MNEARFQSWRYSPWLVRGLGLSEGPRRDRAVGIDGKPMKTTTPNTEETSVRMVALDCRATAPKDGICCRIRPSILGGGQMPKRPVHMLRTDTVQILTEAGMP